MKPVNVLPAAYADLDEIWDHISESNADAADRVMREFERAFERLARDPRIGHGHFCLAEQSGLPVYTLRKYLIIYNPAVKPLLVVAVIHGARDPRSIAGVLADR